MIREIVAILLLLGIVLAAVHLRDHGLIEITVSPALEKATLQVVKELPNAR